MDLKRLMLVPLACCVLVQQTDAEVVLDQDTTAELQKAQKNNNDFADNEETQVEWFLSKVKALHDYGRKLNLKAEVSVAPLLGNLSWESSAGKKDGNVMGGVIAFIVGIPEYSAFYQGSKAAYGKVKEKAREIEQKKLGTYIKSEEDADKVKLEELRKNAMHTEVQLLTKAKADYERWKGQAAADAIVHIYTHSAPCSGRLTGGNCCAFYSSTAAANGWVKAFHIYFDKPTCNEFALDYVSHVNSKERLDLFAATLGTDAMKKVGDVLDKISDSGKEFNSKVMEKNVTDYVNDNKLGKKERYALMDVKASNGYTLKHYYNLCRPNDNGIPEDCKKKLEQDTVGMNGCQIYAAVARLITNALIGLNIGGEQIGDGDSLAECYKDIIFEYAESNQNGTQGQTIKDRFNFHVLAK